MAARYIAALASAHVHVFTLGMDLIMMLLYHEHGLQLDKTYMLYAWYSVDLRMSVYGACCCGRWSVDRILDLSFQDLVH